MPAGDLGAGLAARHVWPQPASPARTCVPWWPGSTVRLPVLAGGRRVAAVARITRDGRERAQSAVDDLGGAVDLGAHGLVDSRRSPAAVQVFRQGPELNAPQAEQGG